MFIRLTKNVNVFVVTQVRKPFLGNIFRATRRPLIRQIRGRIGTGAKAMKKNKSDSASIN